MKISVDEVRAVIALHGASVMAGIQHLSNYLEGMDYSKVFELEVLMDFGREWYEGAANGEQGAEISLLDCYHAYEKCAEKQRVHHLCNMGGTIESLCPAIAELDRIPFYQTMREIFALPDVQRIIAKAGQK